MPHAEPSRLLVLHHDAEVKYWKHSATFQNVLIWDKLGLAIGAIIHVLLVALKSSWYPHVRVVMGLAIVAQAAQLVWALYPGATYMTWRPLVTVLQRMRWFLVLVFVQTTLPRDMLLDAVLFRATSAQMWLALIQVVFSFATPAVQVSLVHSLPFRHQLTFAVLQVIQHAFLGLQHQLYVVQNLGLQQQMSRLCRNISVLLDPTVPFTAANTPTFCGSEHFHPWVLLYLHIIITGIIPLLILYTAEYNSKVRFLQSQEANEAGSELQARYPAKPWLLGLMQCWGCCSVTWSAMIVVWTFAKRLSPQPA
jgi:hypothetical protein